MTWPTERKTLKDMQSVQSGLAAEIRHVALHQLNQTREQHFFLIKKNKTMFPGCRPSRSATICLMSPAFSDESPGLLMTRSFESGREGNV